MYVPCFTTCDYTFYVHYLIYPFLVNLTLFNELDDSIFRRKLRNCQDWSSHLVANAKSIVPLSPCTQIHGWAIRPAYPALSIFKFRPFLANSQLHRTATFPRGKWTDVFAHNFTSILYNRKSKTCDLQVLQDHLSDSAALLLLSSFCAVTVQGCCITNTVILTLHSL